MLGLLQDNGFGDAYEVSRSGRSYSPGQQISAWSATHALLRPRIGTQCSEDLLAFTAKDGGAKAMDTSVAAWARFATHLGACGSGCDPGEPFCESGCDAGAIQEALEATGRVGTYELHDTCDIVYNCDELKEALVRRGTPEVLQMFRPQAELFDL